jgi:hypothetical protein
MLPEKLLWICDVAPSGNDAGKFSKFRINILTEINLLGTDFKLVILVEGKY